MAGHCGKWLEWLEIEKDILNNYFFVLLQVVGSVIDSTDVSLGLDGNGQLQVAVVPKGTQVSLATTTNPLSFSHQVSVEVFRTKTTCAWTTAPGAAAPVSGTDPTCPGATAPAGRGGQTSQGRTCL